ncbi:MAG: nucleotidyltransferase family protein [Fimbriimonadaceae bacterium]|nr:nucleotidyltransferase family protein [Chitinophagales bacterium]
MISEAIVLAGGYGTRLQSVIADIPKPMAPVAGKPFLKFVLDYLIEQNIKHCVLAVGHKREVIINYFGGLYKDLKISYSKEDEPLGTGGGIKQALEKIKGDVCFILNGDTFFKVDLAQLSEFHTEKKAGLSIALKPMTNFDRYGTVEIDANNKVIQFREKKYVREGLINGGLYCMNKNFLPKKLKNKFSLEKDVLEQEITKGKIFGLINNNYFIDIGIPDDYEKAKNDFSRTAHR